MLTGLYSHRYKATKELEGEMQLKSFSSFTRHFTGVFSWSQTTYNGWMPIVNQQRHFSSVSMVRHIKNELVGPLKILFSFRRYMYSGRTISDIEVLFISF